MIDYSVLGLFVITIIVFLSTPGPVTLLIANTGATKGIRPALLSIAGTNLASLVLIAISFFVIKGLIAVNESILSWLSFVGGFYLIYLAITMIRASVDVNPSETIKASNYFTNGFMLGISNPKDVLFFIAFFPTFFTVAQEPLTAITVLTIVWIIVDFAVLSLFAFLFSRHINERAAVIFSQFSGYLLLLIGLYAIGRFILNW